MKEMRVRKQTVMAMGVSLAIVSLASAADPPDDVFVSDASGGGWQVGLTP